MLNERTIEILEKNDIAIHSQHQQDGKFYRELEFFSPEGEDVVIVVWYDGSDKGFVDSFMQEANDFDVDEHASMWIENRGKVGGVPSNVMDLVNDAVAIKRFMVAVGCELTGRQKPDDVLNHYLLDVTFCAGSDEPEDTDKGLYLLTTDNYYSADEMKQMFSKVNSLLDPLAESDETQEFEISYDDGLNIQTLMAGVEEYSGGKVEKLVSNIGRLDITDFYVIEPWQ